MIKQYTVKNFQSWREANLVFSPGVNIIYGLGTSGKTALISRSLKLLVDNRPLGAKFYSDFADKKGSTEIILETEEGNVIKVEKKIHIAKDGKKVIDKTEYSLNDQETPFSGVKEQVPDVIIEALNFSELNRQKQFDQPFLVMSSPGEIGRIINRITRLEEVDSWIGELKSDIDHTNRSLKTLESDLVLQEQELKKYSDIEETEEQVEQLKSLDEVCCNLDQQTDYLEELIMRYELVDNRISTLKSYLKAEKYLNRADKIQKDLDFLADIQLFVDKAVNLSSHIRQLKTGGKELETSYNSLSDLAGNFQSVKEHCFSLEIFIQKKENIARLANMQLDLAEEERRLKEIVGQYDAIHEDYIDLKGAINDFSSWNESIKHKTKELKELKDLYLLKLKELKICPTCFQTITDKHLHKMEASL